MEYQVRLQDFEGPLDLLLHLVEKAELDIREIFVSEITSQYIRYMEQIDGLDMERASAFINMAATLLYIKSRALLPRPLPEPEEEGEEPEQVLIRQLREYKAFKEASEGLRELGQQAALIHCRLPEEYPLPPQKVRIEGASLSALYEAFAQALLREKAQQERQGKQRQVRQDEYSVGERISSIRSCLRERGKVRFCELFAGGGRMKLIVSFMALLEMMSNGEVTAQQEGFGCEITICARHLQDTLLEEGE